MALKTIAFILGALLLALGVAWFTYFFKRLFKGNSKTIYLLATLRFLGVFGVLLLLINPKIEKLVNTTQKANLVLLLDNSASIPFLKGKDAVVALAKKINEDQKIAEKFEVQSYNFGSQVVATDSLNFKNKLTNLNQALNTLESVFRNVPTAYVIATDGNQTFGKDYTYTTLDTKAKAYGVVVGDTTTYKDLMFTRVQSNRYTFLKNKFPFECSVYYTGKTNEKSILEVRLDNQQVFSTNFTVSPNRNTKNFSGLITSNSVGLKSLTFALKKLPNEKNTYNNTKELAVEVIDQELKVALVTNILHPDIGTFKKTIEYNQQRSVDIVSPNASVKDLSQYDFYILYQPSNTFKSVFELIENKKAPYLVVTGVQTNWNFLNTAQNLFSKTSYNQTEEILPIPNQDYKLFNTANFTASNCPPLIGQLGELTINKRGNSIFNANIKGVSLNSPLIMTFDINQQKSAVILGENIWQWRAATFKEKESFQDFDNFIEQLVRYLSDGTQRNRLEIYYDAVFESPALAKINAVFYDQAFNFMPQAQLELQIKKGDQLINTQPLILGNNNFEADLSFLAPDTYNFTVTEKKSRISKTGRFKIIDFNLEEQNTAANYKKLGSFTMVNNGSLYYPNQIENLLQDLKDDTYFTPKQKSSKQLVTLISYTALFLFIVICFGAEWLLRKYNGLT